MEKSQELREVLLRYLDADLERIIFSNPRTRESYLKLTVRPLLLRGALAFQTEEFTEKQAFQKNQNAEKTVEYLLGELENRLCKELWAEYPEIMNCFRCENDDVPVPGGESHREFDKRIANCLESLAGKHPDQKILLVTHGGVMRSIFKHVVGCVAKTSLLPLISNVSYSRFCKRDGLWQLCCWNDVSHLKNIGVRESATF